MNVRNLFRGLGLSFLLYSSDLRAEYYTSSRPLSFDRDDVAVAGLEIIVSCAIAGLPQMPKLRKVLTQCGKGALAGIVIYGGEKAASHVSTPGMGWVAQILVNGGASMRENAARDKGLLEEVNYTFGPLAVRIGENPNWYVHPGFAVAVAEAFRTESSLNLEASLLSGILVFEYTDSSRKRPNSHVAANAIFINRTNVLLTDRVLRTIYSHEAIHVVQYRSFGTAEIGLRTIPSYVLFSDITHLVYGADLGQGALYMLSLPFAHENKPVEFVAERLVDKKEVFDGTE